MQFPPIDELPAVAGQPQGCMWGFWDKDGDEPDELGSLNLLTPERAVKAARLITTGQRFQLDWELHNVTYPSFGRQGLQHLVRDRHAMVGTYAADDQVLFNTQCGSQWDGLKHFANQASGKYYNGLDHAANVTGPRNGIHKWCEAGGMAGRGVLLDWLRWFQHKHPGETPPSPVAAESFSVEDLDAVAEYQGTILQTGDILIIRSGFVQWHDNATDEERKQGTTGKHGYMGLASTRASVDWLYKHHFSAVAGDMYAFEAWPPADPKNTLHDWLLVQWGTPIGEMWDLERLSAHCETVKKWEFFFTSAPLHVKGGVGSTPNALAMF